MHEGELGGPFYRQPEAVAVNGDFRRWLRWRSARSGVIRESSAIVGVYWVRFDANRTWIRSLGQALVGTGRRGSVGGIERIQGCRATATVARACASMHEATRRAEGRWAAPNGVEPPFRPLSAATGGPDAAEDASEGGPVCHRRQEGSKHACEAPDKRERLRGTCQVHCLRVRGTDERKRH